MMKMKFTTCGSFGTAVSEFKPQDIHMCAHSKTHESFVPLGQSIIKVKFAMLSKHQKIKNTFQIIMEANHAANKQSTVVVGNLP